MGSDNLIFETFLQSLKPPVARKLTIVIFRMYIHSCPVHVLYENTHSSVVSLRNMLPWSASSHDSTLGFRSLLTCECHEQSPLAFDQLSVTRTLMQLYAKSGDTL